MVKKIKKKRFKKLDILVPQIGEISNIPKTMIFVDKIENEVKIEQYLQSFLSKSMLKKGHQII